MRPYQAPHSSRRLRIDLKPRRVIFAPLAGSAGAHLRHLEGLEGATVVYLTGPAPASWRDWQRAELPAGWSIAPSYFEGTTPILRYDHAGEEIGPVELHHASEWFGAGDYSEAEAKDAWCLLEIALAEVFPKLNARLLATPATTGRDLARRLFPGGAEYAVLDSETQDLLRSTLGQARIEGPQTLLRDYPDHLLPGAFEYDGRLMYAALCWSMPSGVPHYRERVPLEEIDDYAHARYHVRARVPRDWPHAFGILGVKAGRDGWAFPCAPGIEIDTWCDGSEFRLARREGYALEVLESLTWPTTSPALRKWADALVRLREHCVVVSIEGRYSSKVLTLARFAVRHMILTAIGAFQGRPHKVTREAPIDDPPADMPFERARIEGDVYQWSEEDPPAWPEMIHPEWSAVVWGRGRARLLEGPAPAGPLRLGERTYAGILHCQPGTHVIALRTDAIYVDRWQPWADDGAAGRFRLVRYSHDPVPTPRSAAEVARMRAQRMTIAQAH